MTTITSIAELEACVGVAGLGVKMKIVEALDEAARGWIAAAPLAFIGVGSPDGPRVGLAGGEPGFATVTHEGSLVLPLAALDPLGAVTPGQGCGVLFLAPGVGETLRANGRVRAVDGERLEVAVEECFVHCAKALIRSDFWNGDQPTPPSDAEGFVGAAGFLALATMDGEGRIDISPKGDPAGLLVRMADGRAVLAERPGNRLAFGYRNIIEEPRVAALVVAPGCTRVARLTGRARLSTDESERAAFLVDGKTPILATIIEEATASVEDSLALACAAPWTRPQATEVDPSAVLLAHLKLNKTRGVAATALRLAATRGLIESGLKANYQAELY